MNTKVTLVFEYPENKTFDDYYKYLVKLISKLPRCNTRNFYLDRLTDIYNNRNKYSKGNIEDTYILWDAVRDDLFSCSQHKDTRTFKIVSGELMVLGNGWEKIRKSEYDSFLNCFFQPDDYENKMICECENDEFKIKYVHDSCWSIWIKCTKCGKEMEYQSE